MFIGTKNQENWHSNNAIWGIQILTNTLYGTVLIVVTTSFPMLGPTKRRQTDRVALFGKERKAASLI